MKDTHKKGNKHNSESQNQAKLFGLIWVKAIQLKIVKMNPKWSRFITPYHVLHAYVQYASIKRCTQDVSIARFEESQILHSGHHYMISSGGPCISHLGLQ